MKVVGLALAGLTIAALVGVVIVPAFDGRGREEECRLNLRNIDRAKFFAALEHRLPHGAAVPREWLLVYLDQTFPACPAGGEYRVNPVGSPPTCSRGGRHALPPEMPRHAAEPPPAGSGETNELPTSTGPAPDPDR